MPYRLLSLCLICIFCMTQSLRAACYDNPLWDGQPLTEDFVKAAQADTSDPVWSAHIQLIWALWDETEKYRADALHDLRNMFVFEAEDRAAARAAVKGMTPRAIVAAIDETQAHYRTLRQLALLHWSYGCAAETAHFANAVDDTGRMTFAFIAINDVEGFAALVAADSPESTQPPSRQKVVLDLIQHPEKAIETLSRADLLRRRQWNKHGESVPWPGDIGTEYVLAFLRKKPLPVLPHSKSDPYWALEVRKDAATYLLALGYCEQVVPQMLPWLALDAKQNRHLLNVRLEALMLRCALVGEGPWTLFP